MPAWRRASSEGARWAVAKPIARPATSSTRTIATSGDAELVAGGDAHRPAATLSVLSGFWAKAQKRDEAAAERARGQHRHAAQAQRDDREPQRAADASASSAPRE